MDAEAGQATGDDFPGEETNTMRLTQPEKVKTPQHSEPEAPAPAREPLPPLKTPPQEKQKRQWVPDFKDQYTRKAAENLGFIESDLRYPTDAELNTYTRNPKLRPLVQKQLYAEVDRRLEELREERHRIREAEKANSARIQARGGQPMMSQRSMEEERLSRAEQRTRREVEQLIVESLMQRMDVERMNQLAEFEAQKKREHAEAVRLQQIKEREETRKRQQQFEEKKKEQERKNQQIRKQEEEKERKYREMKMQQDKELKQKAIEEEKQRQERYQQTQELLKKLEMDRKAKLSQKIQVMEEREQKRKEQKEKELELAKKIRDEENRRRLDIMKRIVGNKKKILNEMRKKASEREEKIQEALKKLETDRAGQIAAQKKINEEKLSRQKKFREERDKLRSQEAARVMEKDELATKRLREMQQAYLEQQIKAQKGDNEFQRKMQAKEEHLKKLQEEKRKETEEAMARKQQRVEQAKSRMQEEREKQGLLERLDREKKSYTSIRQRRKDEAKKRELEVRYNEKLRRIEDLEKQKQALLYETLKRQNEARMHRQVVQEKVRQDIRKTSGTNMDELRRLAQEYSLDYEQLWQRAVDAKSAKKSIQEYILASGGEPSLRDKYRDTDYQGRVNSARSHPAKRQALREDAASHNGEFDNDFEYSEQRSRQSGPQQQEFEDDFDEGSETASRQSMPVGGHYDEPRGYEEDHQDYEHAEPRDQNDEMLERAPYEGAHEPGEEEPVGDAEYHKSSEHAERELPSEGRASEHGEARLEPLAPPEVHSHHESAKEDSHPTLEPLGAGGQHESEKHLEPEVAHSQSGKASAKHSDQEPHLEPLEPVVQHSQSGKESAKHSEQGAKLEPLAPPAGHSQSGKESVHHSDREEKLEPLAPAATHSQSGKEGVALDSLEKQPSGHHSEKQQNDEEDPFRFLHRGNDVIDTEGQPSSQEQNDPFLLESSSWNSLKEAQAAQASQQHSQEPYEHQSDEERQEEYAESSGKGSDAGEENAL